jgi:HEAT repeat protein
LCHALRDVSPKVRAASAAALGSLGDDFADGPLASLMTDRNPDVRSEVAIALGRVAGAEGFEPLAGAVTDSNEKAEVRLHAAGSLGALGDARAVGPLTEVLLARGGRNTRLEAEVRAACAVSLGSLRDRNAVPGLIEALGGDPAPAVRASAAGALAELGDLGAVEALEARLADSDRDVARAAHQALVMLRGN